MSELFLLPFHPMAAERNKPAKKTPARRRKRKGSSTAHRDYRNVAEKPGLKLRYLAFATIGSQPRKLSRER